MCGISGFNWKDENKIKGMVSCLSYRGGDALGTFLDEGISLGHNRLSVIDLSSGANQPMLGGSGLAIVFNGEIYNFHELRKELESKYQFKTKSDTEVILAGYRVWGKSVVERLNGMFSFAIYDKQEQSLFCARDHLGMKPLYYFWDGKKFIFASEIPAILTHDVPRILNKEALNHYFRILFVPEPMTLFKDIYKLPASHTLLLKDGEIVIEPYGKKDSSRTNLSYEESVKALKEKVVKAVERHLIADVPVGVYLSGGIDSSIILAAASRFHKNIKTFTIGFDLEDNNDSSKFNADFRLAERTAKFFNTEHHPLTFSVEEAMEALGEVSRHNSDPISNPTSIAMFLLARFARKEVTVALTGNAGDELFGGYERYRTALWARYLYTRSNLFAKFMFEKDNKLSRIIATEFFLPSSKIKKYYKKYLHGGDAVEALMNADRLAWLPEHFFMLSDKMSMASALEERMPLGDKELLAFSQTLPRKYKVDLSRTKKILKDAFKDDLPEFLLDQPKRGWFSPAAKWFRNKEFANFARGVLRESYYAGSSQLFNWEALHEMLEKHISKEEYNLTPLWAVLTFQLWAKEFKIEI
ncbi:asparagine synthase (glutamine-hydrolyzing) [Candidatus Parcubacteria bacterium]|nr:asparagine synthase (glutamine-hydrolyzing) [Candidatus Parcubacteria bacterium]